MAARPPEALRLALTSARDDGLGWRTAWKLAQQTALKGVSGKEERKSWRIAWHHTEKAWRAAYEGKPSPGPAWSLDRSSAD